MILKQRMFRVKPYSRCIECIKTDHFKCKNCMDKLVNDIIATKDNSTPKHILRRSPKLKHIYSNKYPIQIDLKQKSCLLKHSKTVSQVIQFQCYKKKEQKKFEIHQKYDLWMKNVSRRHSQQQQNTIKNTISQWPIKKRVYMSSADMNRDQVKFQGFERKYQERIRNSQCQEVIGKQRLNKTFLSKMRVFQQSVVK